MLETPLLKNKDELKKFLEYCEQTVEKTGNISNERGPLQLCHFAHELTYPALRYQSKPLVVLLSEVAWLDVCDWERWGAEGPQDCIAGMRCYRSNYSELFDTFNGNQLTSTTLWSFSGPPNLDDNPSQDWDIRNGVITKLTLTYD